MTTAIRKLADRFTQADIDNEVVIMRLDDGSFYSLSGTGAAIWRLIDGERDRAALVGAITGKFHGVGGDIADDIDELLVQLTQAGLVANG